MALVTILQKAASRRTLARTCQRGSSLLYALLALGLLALAAVAVTRSASTGSLIVGNLSFKQEASLAGDGAAESAMTWLQNNVAGAALHADGANGTGYFAAATNELDALNKKTNLAQGTSRAVVDWNGDNCASVSGNYTACLTPSNAVSVGGNSARYIITRLCSGAGDPNAVGNQCATPLFAATPDDQNRSGYDYAKPTSLGDIATSPLYRIVVRTAGARGGTASFTETIVHF